MSGPVLLSSVTASTDAQAQLSLNSTRYTDATFTFKNPSASQGTYRIVTGNQDYTGLTARTPEITVEPNATKTVVAVKLVLGSIYNCFLQRKEFGSWVRQGDARTATTKKIDNVNVSTSSKAAVVSWDKTHAASYTVRLYDKSASTTQIQGVDATLNTSTNRYEAVFTGLSNTISYRASIQTVEKNMNTNSGSYFNQWQAVGTAEFTPSSYANLDLDAVYASYAELSWDDGDVGGDEEDEEAEFRILRTEALPSTSWSVVMDWTPDTTKTFTDTDLIPGSKYQYQLYRRGVDGTPVYQNGSQITVSTKIGEVTNPWVGSTVMVYRWTETYEGATQKYRITPASGGEAIVSGVTGVSVTSRNLIPDTSYTFEYLVVENRQDIVVGTFTSSTSKYGVLTLEQARYTNLTFNIQNFSTVPATHYRITNEDASTIWATKALSPGETASVEIAGFQPGSTHKMFLQRAEQGVWNNQLQGNGLLDNINVAAKSLTATTSVATTSAMIQWDRAYDAAEYEISLYDVAPDTDTVPIKAKTNGELSTSGVQLSAVFTGLAKEKPCWGKITALETNTSGVAEKMLVKPFTFETSAGAVFQVGEIKASSVSFSWDAGVVQEEDGVAEFRVRKQELPSGGWADATGWLPHTTNSQTTISGLKAGTGYKFALIRLRLDGGMATQAIVIVTTKTSTLTISGTASSHIQAEWTELYPGAKYQLVYTAEGGSPVTFGGAPITGTTALLKGLESSTEYVVELFALEDGVAVGLATSALGSAASAKTGVSPLVIGGAVVAGAAVVGLVIFKIKSAKTALAVSK
ncbi:unnamed protein product [Ectocarpus sp. CCAP 1310/34]|nr:unnamed protein product [Ectocarpus sp. CCAP 1310/34]